VERLTNCQPNRKVGHHVSVRIESGRPGSQIPEVVLFLTRSEAQELKDTLEEMLRQEAPDRRWHGHVPSSDYASEITVAWLFA
jgi:hypothetical protein